MTHETPVLVIADDLTGANAAGGRFASAGLRSATVSWNAFAGPLPGFDAVIVATDSRHIPAADAASRVRTIIDRVPGAGLVVKRIDTTLRGNISSETAALLAGVRAERPAERVRALVVTAYPSSGRTTLDGVQLLGGVPLEQTELRYDVHNPMSTSNVSEIFAQQEPLTSRHIGIDTVLGDGLEAALAAGDEDLVICDALEDAHIERIAVAAANVSRADGVRWVTVDPGPAGAYLARELGLPDRSERTESSLPPLLAAIGSVTDLSIAQADRLAGHVLVHVLEVDALRLAGEREGATDIADPVGEVAAQLAELLASVSFPEQVLLRVQPPSHGGQLSAAGREALPALFAAAVARALETQEISGVYSSGGDITSAILDAAAVRAFEVSGEVLPLAVYGTAVGGALDGVPIVTKGGLIGSEDTAEACMQQLRALAELRYRRP